VPLLALCGGFERTSAPGETLRQLATMRSADPAGSPCPSPNVKGNKSLPHATATQRVAAGRAALGAAIDAEAVEDDEAEGLLFDSWFDPIEDGLRAKVRGFIETMIEEELTRLCRARAMAGARTASM
jgi:hypothetical protein